MPFVVASVAFVFDDIEGQRVFVRAGISNVSVSGFDHDVQTFVTVVVSVSVLVEAVVGDVLSDLQAVETHVSEGNGVSIVRDLISGFQIMDQESPFVDQVHFSCEESLSRSDASFCLLLLKDAVHFKFVVLCSHIRVNVVWSRSDIWVTQLEIFAVFGGEFTSSIRFLSSHHECRQIDKIVEDGSFGILLVSFE